MHLARNPTHPACNFTRPARSPNLPYVSQVPVFYSERVVLQDEGGGSSFPFFFSKATRTPTPTPTLPLKKT